MNEPRERGARTSTGGSKPPERDGGALLIRDMTSGSVFARMIHFAVPTMLANLMQVAYNLVDMAVVGRFLGSPGISAVSTGADLLQLFVAVSTGFSVAVQVLVSQAVGAKDDLRLQKIIGTSLTLMTAFSLSLAAFGVCFADRLIHMLNVPDIAAEGARAYCEVCFIGLIPTFWYSVISAMARGMGDSKRPLFFIGAASALNITLDYLFVGGFGLGVRGAALATFIAQTVSFALSFTYFYRRREAFHFDFQLHSFLIDRKVLARLLRLGIPFFTQYGTVDFSRVFVASFINSFGVILSAVTGVGAKITSFASVVTNSIHSASTTIIAQNYGAREWARIQRTLFLSLIFGLLFSTAMSIAVLLFSSRIFSLFTAERAVLAAAVGYVPIIVLDFYGGALRLPMSALLQGSGNGNLNMLIALLDGIVVRVGLAVCLGVVLKIGIIGFWLSNSLAGYVPFLVGGIYYLVKFRPMILTEEAKD